MLPQFIKKIPQGGYVGLAVVVFMLAFAMLIYPNFFPTQKSGGPCMAGEPPSSYEEISMPPVGVDWASEDFQKRIPYVLIRKNIPVTSDLTAFCPQLYSPTTESCPHFGSLRLEEYPSDVIAYPNPPAEHDYINTLLKKEDSFFPLKEKVIFFLHMDSIHKPKIVSIRPSIGEYEIDHSYEKILVVDAYQEKSKYEEVISGRAGYNYADVFQCDEQGPLPVLRSDQIESILSNPGFNDRTNPVKFPELETSQKTSGNVLIPDQSRSNDSKQLQLEWFLLDKAQGAWGTHCKPAVYLYPPQKSLINVKVFPKGDLTYTEPVYDKARGWLVEAYPDGSIFDLTKQESRIMNQGKKYDYLYYESKLLDSEIKKPQEGWVVKGSEILKQESRSKDQETLKSMNQLFDEVLPKLGLNEREKADFEDYWLSKLPESPYYFVGLVDKSQRDYLERLSVTPEPETSIRFSLYFEMLDQPKFVKEPVIKTPKREGFTLVDWGGMIKLHPGTEFTCSQ